MMMKKMKKMMMMMINAEPEHFKTFEASENWIKAKRKELKWLSSKIKNAKTPEQKEKAQIKLENWLKVHPTLEKKLVKELYDHYNKK